VPQAAIMLPIAMRLLKAPVRDEFELRNSNSSRHRRPLTATIASANDRRRVARCRCCSHAIFLFFGAGNEIQ